MLLVCGESDQWEPAALVHIRDPERNEEMHCIIAPFSAMPSTSTSALSRARIICPRVTREAPLRTHWIRRPWSDAGRGVTVIELSAEGAHSLIWWGAKSHDVIQEMVERPTRIFDWGKPDSEPVIMEALEEQTFRINGQTDLQLNTWFGNSSGKLVAILPRNSKENKATRLDAVVQDFIRDRALQLQ